MAWDALILFIVGIYATFKTGRFAYRLESLKFICYAVASLLFTIAEAVLVVDSITQGALGIETILEFSTITSVSFVLCGLALFIRESKPVFAQFPIVYAAVPLLLVFSYWLVRDSFAIKQWLMSIYQGGALLVALLMFGARTYKNSRYVYLLSASILFSVTFIVYWFIPIVTGTYPWMWHLLIGISLLITVKGFEFSNNFDHKAEQQAM